MQKEPKIKWSFKMKMAGEGADLETAFFDAVINSGLQDYDGTDCEPVIESFTCPCGNECTAVQSDLENELARDYVCKVDGRRWNVDFEGEVYEKEKEV